MEPNKETDLVPNTDVKMESQLHSEPVKGMCLVIYLAHLLEKTYYKAFARKLALTGNEKVIDFGSGAGSCAKCLAAELNNGELTCIDISRRWITIAARRLKNFQNIKFLQGNLADLNLKPESYDLVIIHFVIHDIPKKDRHEPLKYLHQALRPRGRIIIREPLNEKHGMQAEELHNLLVAAGFKRFSLTTNKIRFRGNVAEGIYEKYE
jgi:ubiquinone/menaquinone biosynthesis C-methylase UbiE